MAVTFTSHHLPRKHFPLGKCGHVPKVPWIFNELQNIWPEKGCRQKRSALPSHLQVFLPFISTFHRTQFITLVTWDTMSSFFMTGSILLWRYGRVTSIRYNVLLYDVPLISASLQRTKLSWWNSAGWGGDDKEKFSPVYRPSPGLRLYHPKPSVANSKRGQSSDA
jgi:hypothetical protein